MGDRWPQETLAEKWGGTAVFLSVGELAPYLTQCRLVTVGDRTFSAAGSRLWNSMPRDVTECQTLAAFRRKLKHFLLSLSFPGQLLFSVSLTWTLRFLLRPR